ncbi:MAG: hypothetical protein ACI83I_002517, partial [Bacteroidia bacterium]
MEKAGKALCYGWTRIIISNLSSINICRFRF